MGSLSLGQEKFKSWNSVHTRMAPFFINWNRIGNPSGIRDVVYKSFFMQFLDLNFDGRGILWVDDLLPLENEGNIGPFIDAMFNDRHINTGNFSVGANKNITKLLKKCLVGDEFYRRA